MKIRFEKFKNKLDENTNCFIPVSLGTIEHSPHVKIKLFFLTHMFILFLAILPVIKEEENNLASRRS